MSMQRAAPFDRSSDATTWRRWVPLVLTVLAIAGFAIGAIEARVILDRTDLPRDLVAYLRAGDAFRAGAPIYTIDLPLNGAFLYSPVWALIFGAISWLPGVLLYAVSIVISVACLRYVVGSWRGLGITLLWPFTAFALLSGNLDLIIAAALVAAWRGHVGPLALVALAKIAPALGLPWRSWRRFAAVSLVLIALTLPWWHLWPEWLLFLVRQPTSGEFLIPIPWWTRLPVAVLLLALRRPWATALAAVVATPALYLTSSLLLLAPLRLWLDRDDPRLVEAAEGQRSWRPWLRRPPVIAAAAIR
jgi:hypothetical protein